VSGGRRLAGFLVAVASAWLIAVPAAIGAVRSYASPYPASADYVAFDAKVKGGDNIKVTGFGYSGFTFPCSPAPYSFFGSPFQAKVNRDGEFRIHPYGTDPGDPKAVIHGRFNRGETAAHGSFTVKGVFPGPLHCEGGHTWVAKAAPF
jgi:hypothetical protein